MDLKTEQLNRSLTNGTKTKTKPLVSVIMPIHNGGKYLDPAVKSILNQTYRNFELILVDDFSTDDTWKRIKSYKKRYPKAVKICRTQKVTNAAGNGAMNYGLKLARGEFIARMDADDVSFPNRIEKQVKFLLKNSNVILVGSQAMVINGNGKITGIKNMPVTHKEIYENYGILHPIIHPSVMIRRSLLPNPNRIYEMKWDVNDDYYTFFKLLNYGKFANLKEYLIKYRIHGSNLSLQHPKAKFFNSVKIRIDALKNLNYRISAKAAATMLFQVLVISLMPEKAIVPFYMAIRGMKLPVKKIFNRLTRLISPVTWTANPKAVYTITK